jgi:hypothetical protein
MKKTKIMSSATLAIIALSLPAAVQASTGDQSHRTEILQRGPGGRATVVRVNGQDYDVCSKVREDGCINPYQAGLKWGHQPMNHWPGRPASEINGRGHTALAD